MSISLPNGTILAAPSQPQLSAAVTRILHLTNFSPELKTRDIQIIFKDWETEKGGFRIKWLDDVNALVVFNDAGVAKRAYLSLLLNTPQTFPAPAQIRPYDRPDAAGIIAQLSARAMGHRASMSSAMSFSQANPNGISGAGLPEHHGRASSVSGGMSGFVMPAGTGNGGRGSISASGSGHHSSGSQSGFGGSSGFGSGGGGGIFGSANGNRDSNGSGTGTGTGAGAGSSGSTSGNTIGGANGPASRSRNLHSRTGSSSASSSWTRGGGALGFGAGSGALNFPSSSSGRLPTHSESSMDPSRSSSSEEDTIVIMDGGSTAGRSFASGGAGGATGSGARRDSMSAEKAMREVEKALAQVETKG